MASATRKTVEKVIKVTEGVTLELTAEEAEWLTSHLKAVGIGHPYNIYRALTNPADAPEELHAEHAADRPIEVGDRVRIIKGAYSSAYDGKTGTVGKIDDEDSVATYRVNFPDYDYEWATTVERVND